MLYNVIQKQNIRHGAVTQIGVLGLHEIREILHHMLFVTNINECFIYEKVCSHETTRGFLKTKKKIRIDYQCII